MTSTYSIVTYSTLPAQYHNAILARWLNSARYGNDYFKLISSEAYYTAYQDYINSVLKRPNTKVQLALLSEDKDIVLGFSVTEGPILHYIHVHNDNRRIGIGRALVPPGITTITHLTKKGLAIWSKHPELIFNPFA